MASDEDFSDNSFSDESDSKSFCSDTSSTSFEDDNEELEVIDRHIEVTSILNDNLNNLANDSQDEQNTPTHASGANSGTSERVKQRLKRNSSNKNGDSSDDASRKARSHFIVKPNDKDFVYCNIVVDGKTCSRRYSNKSGISTLKYHLSHEHGISYSNGEPVKKKLN
jgi:hypothetical protein